MKCPACQHIKSRVKQTKTMSRDDDPKDEYIWRKKRCEHCHTYYETIEVITTTTTGD